MSNVLVIGATGYIGSHVAAAFTAAGHTVHALRRRGAASTAAYPTIEGDLADPDTLTTAADGMDFVVHVGIPISDEIDLAGAQALAATSATVIYTTGASVLGAGSVDENSIPDPHPIAAIRPAVERHILDAHGHIIRPGLVYGESGGLVHNLLAAKAVERGVGVYIGEPGTRWPVVHDLARLYPLVAAAQASGIWHGVAETVRLDHIAARLGNGRAVSWPLAQSAAELGPLADLFTRDQDVSSTLTSTRLGWTPVHTSILADLSPVITP